MAHSVELLPDRDTERRIRGVWEALLDADLPSQAAVTAESNRPHVTVVAARSISDDADAALRVQAVRLLPVTVELGAPVVFVGRSATVALCVVPTAHLLDVHATVTATASEVAVDPVDHCEPGRWTAHVTVARRVPVERLGDVLRVVADHRVDGRVRLDGLRRWDSDLRTVTDLSG
ncbi:2'-5' RNA ligase family protein [Williamsia sp. SKLECPSW1]